MAAARMDTRMMRQISKIFSCGRVGLLEERDSYQIKWRIIKSDAFATLNGFISEHFCV